MTVKLGKVSFLHDDSYLITAKFISVTGLRDGNPVDIMGIEVGRVERITMDQENQQAVVKMKIRKGIKIYDDAIASIKTEGLMGNQYISIDPGGSGALLGPNGIITETQAPVDIIGLISKYAFGDVKKQ
jgi:phospholipid/cholesterol/gamma-HCH transport system substrate-binding protein